MKFKFKDLRGIFEREINVKYIAEELIYCDNKDVDFLNMALDVMKKRHFDILGFKENGIITKYITKEGEIKRIEITEVIADSTPIINVLFLMKDTSRLFILEGNKINGIVTRADLQKAPVLLLFFGLITLFELQCTQFIRIYYIQDSWKQKLNETRLNYAKNILKQRKERNEDINLLDCLQFCDKVDLVLTIHDFLDLLHSVDINSKKKGESFLDEAQKLRDKLAHAQDIRRGTSWVKIIYIIEKLDKLSQKIEEFLEKYR